MQRYRIDFPFKISFTSNGVVPETGYITYRDELQPDSIYMDLCVKQSDIDVVTFATDLRAPFMVISPEFAMVSLKIFVLIYTRRIKKRNKYNQLSDRSQAMDRFCFN